jgi:hypothetical protein
MGPFFFGQNFGHCPPTRAKDQEKRMESSEGTVRDERRGEKVRFGPKGCHKTARLYFLWLVASGCLRLLLRPTAASASKRREIQDVFVSGHSAREWRDVNAHLVCALHQNCLRAEDLSFFPPNRSLFLSFFLYLMHCASTVWSPSHLGLFPRGHERRRQDFLRGRRGRG